MQPGHIYDPKPRAVTSIAHREVRSIVEEHSRESDAGLICWFTVIPAACVARQGADRH
jgi:hypothetical protein